MTKSMDTINQIIEHSLYHLFLPIVIKILLSALIPAFVGLIILAAIRNTPLPNTVKFISCTIIKIVVIICIGFSTTTTIKGIDLSKIPIPTMSGENPIKPPAYTDNSNPLKPPVYTDNSDPLKPPIYTDNSNPLTSSEYTENKENPQ